MAVFASAAVLLVTFSVPAGCSAIESPVPIKLQEPLRVLSEAGHHAAFGDGPNVSRGREIVIWRGSTARALNFEGGGRVTLRRPIAKFAPMAPVRTSVSSAHGDARVQALRG